MKKQFKLDEIDCANCARELQDELAKLDSLFWSGRSLLRQS